MEYRHGQRTSFEAWQLSEPRRVVGIFLALLGSGLPGYLWTALAVARLLPKPWRAVFAGHAWFRVASLGLQVSASSCRKQLKMAVKAGQIPLFLAVLGETLAIAESCQARPWRYAAAAYAAVVRHWNPHRLQMQAHH